MPLVTRPTQRRSFMDRRFRPARQTYSEHSLSTRPPRCFSPSFAKPRQLTSCWMHFPATTKTSWQKLESWSLAMSPGTWLAPTARAFPLTGVTGWTPQSTISCWMNSRIPLCFSGRLSNRWQPASLTVIQAIPPCSVWAIPSRQFTAGEAARARSLMLSKVNWVPQFTKRHWTSVTAPHRPSLKR